MVILLARVLLARVLLAVLLAENSLSSSGTEQASPCPPRWLLFGQRCLAFYPVWSSWTSAHFMCSQTGGELASLHTPEERQFVHQLANTHTSVWIGGHQNDSFQSDDSSLGMSGWTNQRLGKATEGGACLAIIPQSGELHSAPCGELRFYICSTTASSSFTVLPKPAEPGILPNVSLFDVMWGFSDSLAEVILQSSSFLKELRSGQLTQRCYANFIQQEALYLHRVISTLEVLIGSLQEADDVRSLLLDTLISYSSRDQSPLASPPPQWLLYSLQSFHSVVLEEPVYWLVALSARAGLRQFLAEELLSSGALMVSAGSEVKASSLYQEWTRDSLKEVNWTLRYRKVIEERQQHMDVLKAINIFREHMMNQKSFYKAIEPETRKRRTDDEEEQIRL